MLEATILFADAGGFTRFSEGRAPEEVAQALNALFHECNDILLSHDAMVDKLMGDEVMAVFGAPIVRPDHAQQAVEAALAIQRRASDLFPADWEGACLRIGIHSGTVFVGRIGSGHIKDYTAVGDVVNVASRLQTEAQPGEVLVSDVVYREIAEPRPKAEERRLFLKGRAEPVTAFALGGFRPG